MGLIADRPNRNNGAFGNIDHPDSILVGKVREQSASGLVQGHGIYEAGANLNVIKFHASRQIYCADERKWLVSASTTIHDEYNICHRINRYGVAFQFQLYRPDRFERVTLIDLDLTGVAINYKQFIGVRSIE